MKNIKVVHHSKGIGYAGTDRVAQLMCAYLDLRKFDSYILYRKNADHSRIEYVKNLLGTNRVIQYEHQHGENVSPYWPRFDNFVEALHLIQPDIIHFHKSGYTEWPCLGFLKKEFPLVKFVETNIFANNDNFPWDLRLFISRHIADRAGYPNGEVLYNPVEKGIITNINTQGDKIILGRIGRPDNFCDISLRAIKILIDRGITDFIYKVINPCNRWLEVAKDLGVESYCEFLAPIYKDEELSNFYHSIDILAHARSDGECNSVTISEAQMHGVPIVTHMSPCYNGQKEQIENANCGFCVTWKDAVSYANELQKLILNQDLRSKLGMNGYWWAMENVEASIIVKKLEGYYFNLMGVK